MARLGTGFRVPNPKLLTVDAAGKPLRDDVMKHARYYWLLLAESHLTRQLFRSMVRRIAVLSLPAG